MKRWIHDTERTERRWLAQMTAVPAMAMALGLAVPQSLAQDDDQRDNLQDRTEQVGGEQGADQWDYWEVGYPDHPDVDQGRDITRETKEFHDDYWYDQQDWGERDTSMQDRERRITRPEDLDEDDVEYPYYLRYSTLRDDVEVDEDWGNLDNADLRNLREWRDRPMSDRAQGETARGQLDCFCHVNLRQGESGQAEPQTIAIVRLDDGQTKPVALGPRRDLDNLKLTSGEPVVIHGQVGTINGHPVLMANEIVFPERKTAQRIQRDSDRMAARDEDQQQAQQHNQQQQQQRSGQADQQQHTYTVQGTVEDARQIELQGEQEKHTLLKLNLQNGESVIANLGPAPKSISDLNLEKGDEVIIRGSKGTINDRTVVMASRLQVNDGTQQRDQMRDEQRDQMSEQQRDQMHDQMRDRMSQQRAEQIISNWPSTAKQAANEMIKKYGQPDGVTDHMLVWNDTGRWKEIIVHREEVSHDWPMPHKDVLEQAVHFKVPQDKVGELAKFDSSVIVYQTAGRVAARCHNEAMNILALNLAHEIVKGEKSVDEARQYFEKTAKEHQSGQSSKYTEQLLFESSSSSDH